MNSHRGVLDGEGIHGRGGNVGSCQSADGRMERRCGPGWWGDPAGRGKFMELLPRTASWASTVARGAMADREESRTVGAPDLGADLVMAGATIKDSLTVGAAGRRRFCIASWAGSFCSGAIHRMGKKEGRRWGRNVNWNWGVDCLAADGILMGADGGDGGGALSRMDCTDCMDLMDLMDLMDGWIVRGGGWTVCEKHMDGTPLPGPLPHSGWRRGWGGQRAGGGMGAGPGQLLVRAGIGHGL